MSTRANIIIKDDNTILYFYRHSDGYPEITGADLIEFIKMYSTKLRDNPLQSAGWLILRGHEEYKKDNYNPWKVGAYEPTDRLHADVEYIYVIDLKLKKLVCMEPTEKFWDKQLLTNTKLSKEFKTVAFSAVAV
jgi:hypothetical protein